MAKALLLVYTLGTSGADAKIQALTIPPYNSYAVVNWATATDILLSMIEKADENDTPMSEHLSQIADLQPEPSSWHQHPIIIPVPTRYEKSGEDMVSLPS